jgi:uncharacterized repeat protein (TIGR01451 family)
MSVPWNWTDIANSRKMVSPIRNAPPPYPTGSLNTSQILLEKTVPKQVMVNRDYAYQIVVTNLQSNTLKNIVITDKLPPNFELVSSDPQAGISGDTAQWAVPELGPDRKVVINLVGKASSIGRISSCATVTWDDYICATTEIVKSGLGSAGDRTRQRQSL